MSITRKFLSQSRSDIQNSPSDWLIEAETWLSKVFHNLDFADQSPFHSAYKNNTVVVGYKRKGKMSLALIYKYDFCPNFILALISNHYYAQNFPCA